MNATSEGTPRLEGPLGGDPRQLVGRNQGRSRLVYHAQDRDARQLNLDESLRIESHSRPRRVVVAELRRQAGLPASSVLQLLLCDLGELGGAFTG